MITNVILGVVCVTGLLLVASMARQFWSEYIDLSERRIEAAMEILQKDTVVLEIKLGPNGTPPSKKRASDAAWDVYAAENLTLYVNECRKIKTDLFLAPPAGWFYTINGRSGLTSKGILVQRGIVDTGYTGEVGVVILNASGSTYDIKKGDRIGQLTVHKVADVRFQSVEEFSPEYASRGDSGWGSSGK